MTSLVPQRSVSVVRGDITDLQVDVIVTAANTALAGGGGVDAAVHRKAGPELLAECKLIGGCPTGQARATSAYNLPCKHVVHAVGPVWKGGRHGESDLLASAYRSAFELADSLQATSIAFPAISTGVYRFPIDSAARIAVEIGFECLMTARHIRSLTFSCFDEGNEQAILAAISARGQ